LAKAIKVVEPNGDTGLTQRGFQSRRPIPRVIDEGALDINIAQRTMTARELWIGRYRTLEVSFGLVESRGGKSPKIPQAALIAVPGIQAVRCLAGRQLLLDF